MSLPNTDENGVVQTKANGTPVYWNRGLGYDVNGNLCVTSVVSATDVWMNGWRMDSMGRLVVSQSSPEGQPFIYNAGWPTDKVTGAIITQQNTPAPTDPRIAGVAVGPLGGVYMTEGGYIWSPLALWPDGIATPGMWISPSTLPASFNDYNGTTPVVEPGTVADSSNPVGLAYDLRAGTPALGPELVTNGDFSAGMAGWTLAGYTTAGTPSGGSVRLSGIAPGTNFNEVASQIVAVAAGKTYVVTFPYSIAAGNVVIGLYASGSSGANIGAITGTQTIHVVAISTTLSLTIFTWNGASTDVPFDVTVGPATVKEVPGNHMLQSTSVDRPLLSAYDGQTLGPGDTYDATGYPAFQLYDGVDDGMATAAFAAGTLIDGMDCMIAVRRDSAESMVVGLYSGAGTTKFIGAAESGAIADCFNGVGAPTVWVDGTQLTGETAVTRTTLHTALTAGSFHILEFRGLNLSTWTTAEAGGYGSGYTLNGALGDILLYPSTASTEDKDAARQWLADYYGVTLP